MTVDKLADTTRYIVNPGPKETLTGLKAACSSDHPVVTETMTKFLDNGGSAIDAAIAGCMVQAAVEPFMTNHTGTVTALYYEAASGRTYQLDSMGTFPEGLAPFFPIPKMPSGIGAKAPAACIPGFMLGLKSLYERFGERPWPQLCEDAVHWADEGHFVSSFEHRLLVEQLEFATYFPEGRDFYLPGGYLPNVGARFGSKAMAETLRHVAAEGPDYMITGGWADAFVTKANAMGWAINKSHMHSNPPRWIEPLRFSHGKYEIVGLAPPQAQGVYCNMVSGILRHLKIGDVAPGSAEHCFFMGHALRYAGYHYGFIGDTEIVGDYPIDALLDDAFHAHAARLIKGLIPKADLSEHIRLTGSKSGSVDMPAGANTAPAQPPGSCELSIVDSRGNWVQMMNTLQSGGIPGMVIEGIPMVGSHAEFNNLTVAQEVKLVAGARMRRSLGNTIVMEKGQPVLSLGTPGNVFCTIPQMLTYLLDFGYEPFAAADAPRMLPMGDDNTLVIEDRISPDTVAKLRRMGVNVRVTNAYDFHMGSFQMCFRDKQGRLGATADPRRAGVAGGLR